MLAAIRCIHNSHKKTLLLFRTRKNYKINTIGSYIICENWVCRLLYNYPVASNFMHKEEFSGACGPKL